MCHGVDLSISGAQMLITASVNCFPNAITAYISVLVLNNALISYFLFYFTIFGCVFSFNLISFFS